ncbi:MAG: efflux RND transporter periplasmic adaptor subunit [Gemmataceae bacterium]|nr:efflux RND transporter periplasmic adaptor subunit [Gemmataceae bacterium]
MGHLTGWIAGGVVLLVLGAATVARFQLLPMGPAKSTAVVEERKMVVRFVLALPLQAGQRSAGPVYIAEVRGDNELNLGFEVGGTVERIGPSSDRPWELGATVRKGTELGQLKSDEFVTRIEAANARVKLARVTHERFKNLVKTEAIPQQKLDQAAAELKTSEAELSAAETALNHTVLHAPEDGTVLDRMVSASELVAPGRTVLRFSNLRRMTIEVGVPDTMIGQVKVGQHLPVVLSALPGRTLTGHVSQVPVAGEAGSRLFRVKIKVPNPDGLIKSGMTASVSFAHPDRVPPDTVWVPMAALSASPAANGTDPLAVFVIDTAGKAHKRIVQTDEIAGNLIMVTKGLKAGDKVVVTGVGTLYEGAAVDARPAQEAF